MSDPIVIIHHESRSQADVLVIEPGLQTTNVTRCCSMVHRAANMLELHACHS